MPLYEYQCEACGDRFEVIQKFSDEPCDTCPKCGGGRCSGCCPLRPSSSRAPAGTSPTTRGRGAERGGDDAGQRPPRRQRQRPRLEAGGRQLDPGQDGDTGTERRASEVAESAAVTLPLRTFTAEGAEDTQRRGEGRNQRVRSFPRTSPVSASPR